MAAYYNEIEPYAAQWLRNLIAAGHIAAGDVDTRSIEDVRPDDLRGYTQCHFFAGIGGWSRALRLAGWDDARPVWTGSCPCQPFSAAGKGDGFADERHLWPAWQWLIAQCRPEVVFGEQVEAAIKHGWLDLVQADLEGMGYAFAATGIPAAGVGAPHIRARAWFVADTEHVEGVERHDASVQRRRTRDTEQARMGGSAGELADSSSERRQQVTGSASSHEGQDGRQSHGHNVAASDGEDCGARGVLHAASEQMGLSRRARQPGGSGPRYVEDADGVQSEQPARQRARPGEEDGRRPFGEPTGPGTASFWSACDWIPCRDQRWRPVEPGTFPLAHGVSGRVGRLRAYGNAIVPQVAAEFIKAYAG